MARGVVSTLSSYVFSAVVQCIVVHLLRCSHWSALYFFSRSFRFIREDRTQILEKVHVSYVLSSLLLFKMELSIHF